MATFYIDPSAPVNGSGTASSPFNTWSAVTWTAGNTYKQKRGTTWTSQITPSTSGTKLAPIVIGAYANSDGTDNTSLPKPKIKSTDGASSNCFTLVNRAWITIEDFDLSIQTTLNSGNAIEGYQFDANTGQGFRFRRLDVHDCRGTSGGGIVLFTININQATTKIQDVYFEDCTFTNNGSHGAAVYGDVDGVYYKNCVFDGNGQTFDGHGASSFAHRGDFEVGAFTGPTGTTYSIALTPATFGLNGTVVVYRVTKNVGSTWELTNGGATTTPSAGQFGFTAGTLYVNFGEAITPGFSVRIYVTEAKNIFYYNCTFKNTRRLSIEGAGVQADDGSQIICRGCTSINNGGAGYFLNGGLGSVIEGCLAFNNGDSGITGAIATNSVIVNNTLINNLTSGIGLYFGTANSTVSNNSIQRSPVGIDALASTTAENNNLYNNTVSNQSGVTPTNTVTANPILDVIGRPLSGSPLIAAGKSLGFRRDKDGIVYYLVPSIGAYEKTNVRRVR